MPFIPRQSGLVLPDLIQTEIRDANNEIVPEMTKTFGYAFRIDNEIGAFATNKERSNGVFDPNFDWAASFRKLPVDYQLNNMEAFALAENEAHFNSIKEQIDAKNEGEEYLAQTGALGVVARVSAGLASPINLIPLGTFFKIGKGSKSIISGAAKVGAAGATSASLQELALHSQQPSRTLEESTANIAGGALMSGVLGAGAYAWFAKDAAKFEKLKADLDKDFQLQPDELTPGESGFSGGALFKKPKTPQPETTLNQEGIYNAKVIEKTLGFQDPGLRLIQSEAKNARVAIQNLAEISGKLNKNFEGIASPVAVESLRKIDEGRLAAAKVYGNDQYLAYRQRLDAAGAKDRMTHAEFMEAVTKATNRGDKSDIPEVAKVASYDRQHILNYYADEGLKIKGFFDNEEAIEIRKSTYGIRMYNREKIVQNSPDFINRMVKWLKENDIRTQADNAKGARRLGDSLDFNDNAEYIRAAQDIQRNIIGAQSNVLHDKLGMSVQPKFTKSRKLLYDNTYVEDYLELNREILLTQYSKLMSSRIRIAQKFGLDFLSDNFNEAKSPIVKSIKDEYAKMRIEAGGDAKKTKALFKAEERDLNDVFAVRDRLLGTYGFTSNPDSWLYRFQKQVKQFNVLRLLSGLTTAAFPDVARLVGVRGFGKMLNDAIIPVAKLMTSAEGRAYLKSNLQEVRNMGTALDLVTESRANAINDIMDDFGRHTKAERALDYLGSKFQKVTGIAYWNTALKFLSSSLIQTNMAEAMAKVKAGTATSKEIANLASVGIDKETAKIIQQQIAKHGEKVEGLVMPNLAAWDIEAINAAEIYAAAVTKETDRVIVTPGVATTPLWMSRQGLNLLGQFKSFAFSSIQKTVIPMVQDFDSKTAQMMVGMVGMGTLTAMVKRWESGQEMPQDTTTYLVEGIDRSGLTGWMMDANNIAEKMTAGNLGISKILGTQASSRYAQRGRVESVLGPSAALLSDVMTISSDLAGGDPRKSTVHRVRKMIPFQTLMGVRQTLDILEDEINNSLGITQK